MPINCSNITTINDGFTELTESFSVILSSLDPSVLIGENSSAVVNITDDGDSKFRFWFDTFKGLANLIHFFNTTCSLCPWRISMHF